MSNGVPIVRESSECEFFMLNQRAVKELAGADLPKLFASTVLMDIEAFEALKAGFPGLKFPEKVELEALSASSKAAGADELYECLKESSRRWISASSFIPNPEMSKVSAPLPTTAMPPASAPSPQNTAVMWC